MRNLSVHAGWRRPPSFMPGEVVIAEVFNPVENPRSRGKSRPIVLVRSEGSLWSAIGLTTRRTYADGQPRVAVPSPGRIGLNGPGYLWSGRLVRIPQLDVAHHIGWIDDEMARAIIKLADLDDATASALLDGARRGGAESLGPDEGGAR